MRMPSTPHVVVHRSTAFVERRGQLLVDGAVLGCPRLADHVRPRRYRPRAGAVGSVIGARLMVDGGAAVPVRSNVGRRGAWLGTRGALRAGRALRQGVLGSGERERVGAGPGPPWPASHAGRQRVARRTRANTAMPATVDSQRSGRCGGTTVVVPGGRRGGPSQHPTRGAILEPAEDRDRRCRDQHRAGRDAQRVHSVAATVRTRSADARW